MNRADRRCTVARSALAMTLAACAAWAAADVPPLAAAENEPQREEQRLEQMEATASRLREQAETRAEGAAAQQAAVAEAAAAAPAPSDVTPAAILETLKKRAGTAIARRRARRLSLTTTTTLSTTIETNPTLDSSHKGDLSFEEDGDIGIRWRWFSRLNQDAGYRITNVNYVELRDNNYVDHTPYSTLRLTPFKWLRLTSGYEFDGLSYYENRGSSSDGHRVYAQARHLLPWWGLYQQFGWNHTYRRYSVKHARDGGGNDTDDARHDTKHALHYEIGVRVWKTLVSVRQEGAENYSNDAFQDYYNYQSYKVRSTVAREFWKKWQGTGTFSFERKNYAQRQVSSAAAIAESDNTFSYGLGLTYDLSPNVSLTYNYSRKKLDSNTPSSEYTDTTNQFGLSASF